MLVQQKNCSQYPQQAVEKNAHGGERYNSNSMANHAFNLKLIWKLVNMSVASGAE